MAKELENSSCLSVLHPICFHRDHYGYIFYSGTQAKNIEKIGVGIYQDPKCEESFDHIAWGQMSLDSTVTQTIYIKNELDSFCFLSLSTLNWNPAPASKYLTLEWNYSGQEVAPNQVIPTVLYLTVSESTLDLTDFNFIICISAQK